MKKPDSKYDGITFGLNMAVGFALFSWLGYWIDEKRGGGIAFTLLGILLGMTYCGYEIWKIIKGINKE